MLTFILGLCALSASVVKHDSVFSVTSVVNPHPQIANRISSIVNLSQLPAAEPSQIGTWLISACAVLSAAALARQFTRKTPLEAEFLSRREFQEFKDKDFAELRHRVDHSFQSLSDKLDGINNRLHELRSLVDRVDERTKYLHAWEPQIKTRPSTNHETTDH